MTSIVTGLQGKPPKDHPNGYPYVAGRNNVVACAKHFVGVGGTDKGKNEGDTIISYEDLEKIHMLPYPDCISKGVCTVMASYSSWNGTKLHSHHYLLTDILKEKLGFKGIVISDWEALDRFHEPHRSNYRSAVSSAVNATFPDNETVPDLIVFCHRAHHQLSKIPSCANMKRLVQH